MDLDALDRRVRHLERKFADLERLVQEHGVGHRLSEAFRAQYEPFLRSMAAPAPTAMAASAPDPDALAPQNPAAVGDLAPEGADGDPDKSEGVKSDAKTGTGQRAARDGRRS